MKLWQISNNGDSDWLLRPHSENGPPTECDKMYEKGAIILELPQSDQECIPSFFVTDFSSYYGHYFSYFLTVDFQRVWT